MATWVKLLGPAGRLLASMKERRLNPPLNMSVKLPLLYIQKILQKKLNLNNMKKEDVKTNLFSKKTVDRRKAAKEVGIQKIVELADDLFSAYLKEIIDDRTWETQVAMILALGIIDYKAALPYIEKIIQLNNPHSMVTYAAAQTYVRLKRKSITDAQPVIELLKFGGLSLVDGALNPLAYDRMIPPNEEIITLIKLSWDLHKHKDRIGKESGYCDPRYGLAAACAGWDKQVTTEFLAHCLATTGNDTSLKYVTENSIKQKYVKLR